MRTIGSTAILLVLATTVAGAQSPQLPTTPPTMPQAQPAPRPAEVPATQQVSPVQLLTTVPANAATVTHWYKQPVYDQANTRIGEIDDVLVDRDAKIVVLIIGVGGFLGMGERHVAVAYNSIRVTTKDNNKWYLVLNTTKDAMKNAAHFKYDRTAMTWIPENASGTTGSSTPPTRMPPTAR